MPCVRAELGIGQEAPDREAEVFWAQLDIAVQEEARGKIEAAAFAALDEAERRVAFADVARRCTLVELEGLVLRGFGVDARVLPDVDTDFLHISLQRKKTQSIYIFSVVGTARLGARQQT